MKIREQAKKPLHLHNTTRILLGVDTRRAERPRRRWSRKLSEQLVDENLSNDSSQPEKDKEKIAPCPKKKKSAFVGKKCQILLPNSHNTKTF